MKQQTQPGFCRVGGDKIAQASTSLQLSCFGRMGAKGKKTSLLDRWKWFSIRISIEYAHVTSPTTYRRPPQPSTFLKQSVHKPWQLAVVSTVCFPLLWSSVDGRSNKIVNFRHSILQTGDAATGNADGASVGKMGVVLWEGSFMWFNETWKKDAVTIGLYVYFLIWEFLQDAGKCDCGTIINSE